jgi:hypothetical protein
MKASLRRSRFIFNVHSDISSSNTPFVIAGIAVVAGGVYLMRPSKAPNVSDKPGNTPMKKSDKETKSSRPPPEEMTGGEKDLTTKGQSQGRQGEDKSNARD